MRLRDGDQVCPNCSGGGCYWCRKSGRRQQCPRCMNHEPELLTKDGNEFACKACGEHFYASGKLVEKEVPKPVKKPV